MLIATVTVALHYLCAGKKVQNKINNMYMPNIILQSPKRKS